MFTTQYTETMHVLASVAAGAFATVRQVDPSTGDEARAAFAGALSTLATVQAAAAELTAGPVSAWWARLAERTRARAEASTW